MPDLDEKTRTKIAFAEEVLAILAGERDWCADTLDLVSKAAVDYKLGRQDANGDFAVTR
jgi:hypothetical protein